MLSHIGEVFVKFDVQLTLRQAVRRRTAELVIDVMANAERGIERGQRGAFVDSEEDAGEFFIEREVGGIDAAKERVITLIVRWVTTEDGIEILEPEHIGPKRLDRRLILGAALAHALGGIGGKPHLLQRARRERADARALRRDAAKDSHHHHPITRRRLQANRAATGKHSIVEVWLKIHLTILLVDLVERCEFHSTPLSKQY